MGKEAPEPCREPAAGTTMEKLLGLCRSGFERIEGFYPKAAQCQYRLRDLLALALSMFVFKYPSLYQFLHDINRAAEGHLSPAASVGESSAFIWGCYPAQDVTLRRRLDEVKTIDLAVVFPRLGEWLQQQPLWGEATSGWKEDLLPSDGGGGASEAVGRLTIGS